MKQLQRGVLISIEGIDGSGKSTLAGNLAQLLHAKNYPSLLTREPGATQLGKELRTILQNKTVPVCAQAEFLLFAADRAQHFTEYIVPNLEANKIIISDRMADSSIVYQGYGRGLSLAMIESINQWVMDKRTPDITLYIRLSPEQALERMQQRNGTLTTFEQEAQQFVTTLVHGFETIFAHAPHVYTLEGTESPETLTTTSFTLVEQWLQTNNLV